MWIITCYLDSTISMFEFETEEASKRGSQIHEWL